MKKSGSNTFDLISVFCAILSCTAGSSRVHDNAMSSPMIAIIGISICLNSTFILVYNKLKNDELLPDAGSSTAVNVPDEVKVCIVSLPDVVIVPPVHVP